MLLSKLTILPYIILAIANAIATDDIQTCMPYEGRLRMHCDSVYDIVPVYKHTWQGCCVMIQPIYSCSRLTDCLLLHTCMLLCKAVSSSGLPPHSLVHAEYHILPQQQLRLAPTFTSTCRVPHTSTATAQVHPM